MTPVRAKGAGGVVAGGAEALPLLEKAKALAKGNDKLLELLDQISTILSADEEPMNAEQAMAAMGPDSIL